MTTTALTDQPTRRGRSSTCPASALASAGLLGIVWGLVRGNQSGWSSREIDGSLMAGAAVLAAFAAWELRAPAPMLPMRLRERSSAGEHVSPWWRVRDRSIVLWP
jgi:hypothetical protein